MFNSTEHEISTAHKTKIPTNKDVSCFKYLRRCIYQAKNIKMPTIVGILTFMSKINFVLSCVEHEKSFITSGPDRNPQRHVYSLRGPLVVNRSVGRLGHCK